MNCLPVLFFLPLVSTGGGGSYPPEGADCQIGDTGFPFHWLQQDGQCCRCYEGIVMCQELLPCPQLPEDVDGCDFMDVCGCDWLICNETQNEEGNMEEEGGVIEQGEENEAEASGIEERRKREVKENGDGPHHPPGKVGNKNSRQPKAKGITKGSKVKGGGKGNKAKGSSKGSLKGSLKGSKAKGKGATGKGKGLKGTVNVKGKGKGSKGKGSIKGKGSKGGIVPTTRPTSTTSTTPKGDNGNPSYDYTAYTNDYSTDYYNNNDYTYGDYIYTDYTYNYNNGNRNEVKMKVKVNGKARKGIRNSKKGENESPKGGI